MALNERETYYEQQIKEYQDNLNQLTRETENVRVELKHIQEENDLKEKKTNDLVNELKQNYEKVQNELMDLNDRGLFQRSAGQSRAIAHAYATSPGLAWSACFFISIFDGQTVRMKNTRSIQVEAI